MTIPGIVPRWEWRTFGSRYGIAEARFAAMTPTGVQESDEVYLLGGAGDNVKIRDDLMDIKVLRETDADGLERWEPVMKAGFPLNAADVARTFEALRLPIPALGRDAYTLEQFLDELVAPSGALRAVRVHKRRVRYRVNGCTSEVSDVVVDGIANRTIAIESEDAAAVVAAVASVGLDGFRNLSYPVGLRLTLDGAPERFAVLDVGTNSIKFHVGERLPERGWRRLVDRAEVTRLGEGLRAGGEITAEAQARAIEAIRGMVEEADGLGVRATVAVATAGLRMAANADDVVEAVRTATGLRIRTIPGEDESRLAFLAVKVGLGLADEPIAVFDTGGGSTQLTFGHGEQVDEQFSLYLGAVRITEQFGLDKAVGDDVIERAYAALDQELARLDGRAVPHTLVGMGGAVTNMAAVMHRMADYDPDRIQGSVIDRAEVERQIDRYRAADADGRRGIPGLQPKRAEVILAGACIVHTIMDKLGRDALTVSDRGLRHGVLVERFGL
jgi:exopolyphosphatase/guanosine-5'-triphosphate,3'-diphosphate pyrophosphatase